ncbi:GerAB/ArcD/ProY family transporter [Neobacillus vireti]|uniref:GerAB/ArcD/ProY family transporter n=1 Tax=Neobacillus vireti TaxID=220686 RepID=UPI0012E2DD3A|nr:endospore germination permease [Neobacillus vireti]
MAIKKSDSITVFQLILLSITAIGLKNHVIIISPLIQTAGRDSWLSVIVSLFFVLLWVPLLIFIHKKTKQQHLITWMQKYTGKWLGNFIFFIVILYLTIIAGVTLRETITWVNITFLPKTPFFLLTACFALICWMLAGTGLRTLSIVNIFLLFFIILLGFFVAITNIQYKNFSLLMPFLEHGFSPVIKGTVYQCSGMVELIFLLFLQHKTETSIRFRDLVITAVILTMLTVGPLIGAVIEFGPVEASKQRFPPYEEWGLASLGNFIEHVDFLSIYQWLSGAFIRISLLLLLIREYLPFKQKQKWFLLIILTAITAIPLLPISDFQYLRMLSAIILPFTLWFFLGLSVFFGLLAVIFERKVWRPNNDI